MPGLFVSVLHRAAGSFLNEDAKQDRFPEVRVREEGVSARHRWTAVGCLECERRGKPQAS